MVAFRWGNQNLSLPDSNEYIKTEMNDFLINGGTSFIVKVKRALASVEGSGLNRGEFVSSFKSLSEEVLKTPLQPIMEKEPEGWKKFSIVRHKGGIKNPNESNLNFIADKTLSDLNDPDVRDRLKGMGSTQYISEGEMDIPKFDFSQWYGSKPRIISKMVDSELVLKESEADSGEGKFNFAHNPSEGTLDGHIEAIFPPIDPDALSNAKVDWLMEKTGQKANPKSVNSKSNLAKEIIDYRFVLPEGTINKLNKIVSNSIVEVELDEDGDYTSTGSKIELTSEAEKELNNQSLMTAIGDLNRTKEMKEEDIVQIGDKLYAYKLGDVDASAKVSVNWDMDAPNSPVTFIEDNEEFFMRILKRHLENPLVVSTAKIVGQIKTKKSAKPTYQSKITEANTKKPTESNPEPERYEMLRYMTKGKERMSYEDWSRLDESEKEGWESYSSPLTTEEIKEHSSRAFRHKTEKNEDGSPIHISERDYMDLEEEEKNKFDSTVRIYSRDARGSLSTKDMKDFGGDKYSTSQVTADNIEESFANAYVECTIILRTHMTFNMSPFRQGAANRSIDRHIKKIHKNMRKLSKTLKSFGE